MKINTSKARHSLPTLLLAIFVLYAQISTLKHGIEHLSHDAHELCQVFIGFEETPSMASSNTTLQAIASDIQYVASNPIDLPLPVSSSYSIRAPPTTA